MNYFFITGTSSGIGKAFAELLLKNVNNTVIGLSRTGNIVHSNYNHLTIDLSNRKEVEEFQFKFPFTQIDKVVLVNNAGIIQPIGRTGLINNCAISDNYMVNLVAPSILCNTFIKEFTDFIGEKIIVNISSGAGRNPVGSWMPYCASKAGLDMLTRVINDEQKQAKHAVYALSVAPGIVNTQMQNEIRNVYSDDFPRRDEFIEYYKSGLLTSPENIASKLLLILNNYRTYNNCIISVRDLD